MVVVLGSRPGLSAAPRVPLGPKASSRRLGCTGDRPLQLASISNPATVYIVLTAGWTQEARRDAVS